MSEYVFRYKEDFKDEITNLVKKEIDSKGLEFQCLIQKIYIELYPTFKEAIYTEDLKDYNKEYILKRVIEQIDGIISHELEFSNNNSDEIEQFEDWLEELSKEEEDSFYAKVTAELIESSKIWGEMYKLINDVENDYSLVIAEENIIDSLSSKVEYHLKTKNPNIYYEIDHEYPTSNKAIRISKKEVVETVSEEFNKLIKYDSAHFQELVSAYKTNIRGFISIKVENDNLYENASEERFWSSVPKICLEFAYEQYKKQIDLTVTK